MEYDMVFEGGGAKGIAFVGALQELQARGCRPARLLGTSAGSIMATFLAAGYDLDEMTAALQEERDGRAVFASFLQMPPLLSKEDIQTGAVRKLLRDTNSSLIPDMLEERLDDVIAATLASSSITSRIVFFIEKVGFYAAQAFLDWLEEKLNSGVYPLARGGFPQGEKRRFGGMSLAEFYQATGIDLSLIGSDITAEQILILNHRTAPECPVKWAVRMSMSVPLLWNEVIWQPEWGAYRGRDVNGHAVVDGGLLSNFPIELFLSDQPQVTAVMGDKMTGENVLGLLIDEALPVPDAPVLPKTQPGPFNIGQTRTVGRLAGLLNTMLQAHDKSVIEASEQFVIRLPAKDYGTVEFDMLPERRTALIAAGRRAAAEYFQRLESGQPKDLPDVSMSEADKIALNMLER